MIKGTLFDRIALLYLGTAVVLSFMMVDGMFVYVDDLSFGRYQ